MKEKLDMCLSDIGRCFTRHYQDSGFQLLARSSLLDPTVPMTFVGSAGLTQIESEVEQRVGRADEQYVLVQPCFRHFDMDQVGQSAVHLSLFSMGGAFSFGRVSKYDTLARLWSFLIDGLCWDTSWLWVTYFGGGTLGGCIFEPDEDTPKLWRQLGLAPSRLVERGIQTSFWIQGSGLSAVNHFRKCAATTEVFYDRGLEHSCGADCKPGCKCGRFVEVANVLYIHTLVDQKTGQVLPLTTPFNETVIGVERAAMVSQGKSSVFDLPCFTSLTERVRAYCTGARSLCSAELARSAQVIVDHIRALLFLVADGAPPPGKGGRQRIMRRLIRDTLAHQKILDIQATHFLPDLMQHTLEQWQTQLANPDRTRARLLDYLDAESKRFEHTLEVGNQRLDRYLSSGKQNTLSGEQALTLVKRYGLPFPLLQSELRNRNVQLDEQAYRQAHARWWHNIMH